MTQGTRLQMLLSTPLAQTPDKIALRFGSVDLSYYDLDFRSRQLAAGLLALKINCGDRIALLLPNCLEAVYSMMACYTIGAIVVPVNYRYTAREARYVVENTHPNLVIGHQDKSEILESLGDLVGLDRIFLTGKRSNDAGFSSFDELPGHTPLASAIDVQKDAPALILYTSGSTGHPKGVVHSHGSAFSGIDISRRVFDFNSSDIVLIGKPISHAGGLQTQLMPALFIGAEVVLAMRPTPAEAAALIVKYSITQYALLASNLVDFVEYLEENPECLPTLVNSIGSGDAVPTDLHHRFRDLFGWQVMEGCGMTEIGGYYAINPRYGERKWGSMGLHCPDTELRIIDPDGNDVAVGEVGEIAIRTPSSTIGYWNDDLNTRELFRDGWLHTGDLAKFDEQQYVWFIARKKLIIVRRGSNISPAEVESVIDEHPLIHASVVVGIADPHDGQIPVAWVVPLHNSEGPSLDDLKVYVSARLAAYKTPVNYLFLKELPRNSTGKFDRHLLGEMAFQEVSGSDQ